MKKTTVYGYGWASALLLAIVILPVHSELNFEGTVLGIAITPLVMTFTEIGKCAVKGRGDKKSLAAAATGSAISSIVVLFGYWMGLINAGL